MKAAGLISTVMYLAPLLLTSCGTVPDEARTMAVGTLRLPDQSGPIGLTIIRPGAEFTLAKPNSRQEAAYDMSVGATNGAAVGQLGILFPAAFVVGGFEGLLFGTDEPELRRMAATIERALHEFQSATQVVESVKQQLAPLGSDRIRPLADNLPLDPILPSGKSRPSPRHPLGDSAIKVLIGIRISFLGFQVYTPPDLDSTGDFNRLRHEHNPLLSLTWAVDVMAMRPRDWAAIGGVTARYESIPHRFRDWAYDDAQPLRHELALALQFIRREISRRITVEKSPHP